MWYEGRLSLAGEQRALTPLIVAKQGPREDVGDYDTADVVDELQPAGLHVDFFDWGHEGSAAAESAYAILLHRCGDERVARWWYKEFAREVVAFFRRGHPWVMAGSQVDEWLENRGVKVAAGGPPVLRLLGTRGPDAQEIYELGEELGAHIGEWFASKADSWPAWKPLMVMGVALGAVATDMYEEGRSVLEGRSEPSSEVKSNNGEVSDNDTE